MCTSSFNSPWSGQMRGFLTMLKCQPQSRLDVVSCFLFCIQSFLMCSLSPSTSLWLLSSLPCAVSSMRVQQSHSLCHSFWLLLCVSSVFSQRSHSFPVETHGDMQSLDHERWNKLDAWCSNAATKVYHDAKTKQIHKFERLVAPWYQSTDKN